MRARDRLRCWTALVGLGVAWHAPARAGVLVDTGTASDESSTVCLTDGSVRGLGVYVAALEDTTVGRIYGRLHAVDGDADGEPDPTWDANRDDVLEPGEPSAGKVIAIDLGPTPQDLTTLDDQMVRSFPQAIVYLSPTLVPLTLATTAAPAPTIDSGPVSISMTGGHIYAVGFVHGRGACIAWTTDAFADPAPEVPATLPPPLPGARLEPIGRAGLLGILGGDAGSDFSLIRSDETKPLTVSFELDDTEGAPGGGSGSGGGGSPTFGDPTIGGGDDDANGQGGGCDAGGGGGLALPVGVIALLAVRRRMRRRPVR